MLQRLRKLQESDKGFTLIELLVVVLIIAILAAIAIPIFLRQREKAYIADLQSTLRNSATAAESFAAQATPPGSYTGLNQAMLQQEGLRIPASQTAGFTVNVAADGSSYCVFADDNRITNGNWVNGGNFNSLTGQIATGACP